MRHCTSGEHSQVEISLRTGYSPESMSRFKKEPVFAELLQYCEARREW
jgi:hypothetical protein